MARDKANENEIDPKVIAGIHVLIDFKKGLLTYKKARQQFKALTGLNHDIAEKFKGLLVSAGFHPDSADDLFEESVIGSWKLPSDKNLYADELDDEYDIFDNETNITTESLK